MLASIPRTRAPESLMLLLSALVLPGQAMSPLPPEPWLNAYGFGNEGTVVLFLLFCVLLFQVVTKQYCLVLKAFFLFLACGSFPLSSWNPHQSNCITVCLVLCELFVIDQTCL